MAETYEQMKTRHQKEYEDFTKDCVFFAYSQEQFDKGMESLGLKPNETHKIFHFDKGAFILRTKSNEQKKMFERFLAEQQQAIDDDTDGTGFVTEMFLYELINHECAYTGDILSALEELDLTVDEVKQNPKLYNGLKRALLKIFGKKLKEMGYI